MTTAPEPRATPSRTRIILARRLLGQIQNILVRHARAVVRISEVRAAIEPVDLRELIRTNGPTTGSSKILPAARTAA